MNSFDKEKRMNNKAVKLNLQFHHIGKPVPLSEIESNPQTRYAKIYDMYTLDVPNKFSLPVQMHAFGKDCSLDLRIQTESHVAFTCENIEKALIDQEIIMPLYEPFKGYKCAMILVNQQPIELIATTLSEREIWGDGIFKDSLLYDEKK
ncbi:hypothetical protein FC89_GL000424 [Liquorilactobacillus ghanensis DSM 18630]|uniref:Uncharacterized protein n=2 Tax=Liquorilactobacillus ghanensis TaxID=399370 RepID=A0A0R1VUL7_9LACO|nr:hypothetical protein FC89_GL000424 [Liquorilactobacillus ghanensis DSM 18630]